MRNIRYIKQIRNIGLCVLGLWMANCVKPEPLDIEKDYKQQMTERAKQEQQQAAEAKAKAEAEAEKKWDAYYKMLTEYKEKAWKNTGEKPFIYMWWTGWRANALEQTWLQSIPDTTTAISLWGGCGKQPADMTANEKFDLEMFHKKGSKVFVCWQVSNVGQGLPDEGNKSGFALFREKYGEEKTPKNETFRCQIYARDLARYIIACGFDGFDIDWEPNIGNHSHSGYNEFASGVGRANSYRQNMDTFIREIGKYFGEKYTGEERKQHLRELFNENNTSYHPKEKEYIAKYKPFFEKGNFENKRYFLLFDGEYRTLSNTDEVDAYFSKYIMQDYGRVDSPFTNDTFKSISTSEFEKGHFLLIIDKAKAAKQKRVGGVGSYHGELDYTHSAESALFKGYMQTNKITGRKYKHYAWLREAIRIIDPRSNDDYKDFKEEMTIKKPK